jgi:hypothetical protein
MYFSGHWCNPGYDDNSIFNIACVIVYFCSIYRQNVPERSMSQNLKGFGIFPKAVVERGSLKENLYIANNCL